MRIPGFGDLKPIPLLKRSAVEFLDDDMATYAAALAYNLLFALFPFMLFLTALLGFLRLPAFFDWLIGQVRAALPPQAAQQVLEVVQQIRDQAQGGLLSFGIVGAIWAASAGIRSLMNALNAAYEVEEDRPAWRLYLLSVLYTIGLALLLIVATALMLIGPQVVEWLTAQVGLSGVFLTLWTWLRWPVAILLLVLTVAIIYYVTPNVEQSFQIITPGSAIAVLGWVLASLGFSFYVANFGNYNAMYGSLGAVIVLLLYFFIASAVLLFGGEVNAEIYHAQRRGQPRPEEPALEPVTAAGRGQRPAPGDPAAGQTG